MDIAGKGKSPFFKALLDLGCVSISSYTLPVDEVLGRLAFTVLEDENQRSRGLRPQLFVEVLRQLHVAVRRHGQIIRYLGLTPKECVTLTALAHGLSAADVAEEENVSLRAIEKRLQKSRSKLRARTTVEAVYKAALSGVLHKGIK